MSARLSPELFLALERGSSKTRGIEKAKKVSTSAQEDGLERLYFSPSTVSPSPPRESVPFSSKEGGSGLMAGDPFYSSFH